MFARAPIGFVTTAVVWSILGGTQLLVVLLLLGAAQVEPVSPRPATASDHSPGISYDLRPLIYDDRPEILRAQGIAAVAAIPMALAIGARNRRRSRRYISISSRLC